MMRRMVLLGLFLLVSVVPLQAADSQLKITVAFDYAGDIYVTDFLSAPENITASNTYEMLPAWSPDGTQIAFLSSDTYETWNDARLKVMTLATGEVRPLSEVVFSSESGLTWSPDGQYIAATQGAIFIVDVESGYDWRLPVDCGGTCSVNWLSDSSGLIFESYSQIFRIDLDGEHLQRMTPDLRQGSYPILAPVTGEVVFSSTVEDQSGLFVIDLDDAPIKPKLLFDTTRYYAYPYAWSPDGQYLAFDLVASDPYDTPVPGGSDVYVINRDGSDLRLMSDAGNDVYIGWSNDSQYILYYSGVTGDADGSYYAVSIVDGTQIRLSNEELDLMCSYSNCHNIVVRPEA